MIQAWNQQQQIIEYMLTHKEMTKADGWLIGCTKVDSRISELRRNLNGGRHKVYFLEEVTN